MVRATSKTEWIGAALLLHALDPVLKHVGLNPHLHMSAFLLLLWPRCQWILCWLLNKQENYSTSPPISGLVFLSVPKNYTFPKKFWEGVPSHFTLPVVIVRCSLWSHIWALPPPHCAPATVAPLPCSDAPGTCSCDAPAASCTWNTPPRHICPSPFCRDTLTCPCDMKPWLTDLDKITLPPSTPSPLPASFFSMVLITYLTPPQGAPCFILSAWPSACWIVGVL